MGDTKHASIVKLMFLREHNLLFTLASNRRSCDDCSEFWHHSQRLLIRSRSQVSSAEGSTSKAQEPWTALSLDELQLQAKQKIIQKKKSVTKNTKQSSEIERSKWIHLAADVNSKHTLHLIDNYFLLRTKHKHNENSKNEIICRTFSFTPKATRLFSFQHQFKDLNTEKWAAHEMWYPSEIGTMCTSTKDSLTVLKQKVAVTTLIVLHKPNKQSSEERIYHQSIDLYNFANGQKLDTRKIKSEVNFKEMVVFHFEGKIVCTATRASLHKEVAGQFLIFTIPPFDFKHHLQILKTAVDTDTTEIELNCTMLFMITKKTTAPYVEISDFEKVMEAADRKKIPSEGKDHQVTHILHKKPEVLWKVITNEGYLALQPYASPTISITKSITAKNNFRIATYQGEDIKVSNGELLTHYNNELVNLKFFPEDDTPTPVRLLYGGIESSYCLYACERVEGGQCLRKIFPEIIPQVQTTTIGPTDQSEGRRPSRNVVRKSYCQPSYEVHDIDYNSELNLFVVGLCDLDSIKLTLYDFNTMKLYGHLPSVKILKKDRVKEDDCAQFIVDFYTTFICVRFNSGSQKKRNVYCLSLMEESITAI